MPSQSFPVPSVSVQPLQGLREARRKHVKEVRTQDHSCNAWESGSDAGQTLLGEDAVSGEKKDTIYSHRPG